MKSFSYLKSLTVVQLEAVTSPTLKLLICGPGAFKNERSAPTRSTHNLSLSRLTSLLCIYLHNQWISDLIATTMKDDEGTEGRGEQPMCRQVRSAQPENGSDSLLASLLEGLAADKHCGTFELSLID